MSDYPIIFSAPMVRALLDGRKTMTRRLAWDETYTRIPSRNTINTKPVRCKAEHPEAIKTTLPSGWQRTKPGDRLWARESISRSGALIGYVAGGPSCHHVWPDNWKQDPRPSIHMPRWASRLTLVVTAAKIEPLQDIGWTDAIAEGIARGDPMPEVPNSHGTIWHSGVTDPLNDWTRDPTQAFRDLWAAIHGAAAWDQNPEVVALTFTVHKANIDQMKAAA